MLRRALPIVMAIVLVAIGFTQLDRYNVTWDEALGDFFFGQRYLSFFSTLDRRYLDFTSDPYPSGFIPDLRSSEFRNRPWEYWPVANTLAATTSRVLSNGLGVVDPFDGFHAFNLLAAAILLIIFFRVVERHVALAAAVVATLLLFLMPRVVGDLMANIKDFPEMVFFSLALLTFFVSYERGLSVGLAASGVIWGLALGTKANAWFLPFIVVAYVAMRGMRPRLLMVMSFAAILGVAVMFVTWPYLWSQPFERLLLNFRYLSFRAGHARPAAVINPWLALVLTTPPAVTVLFVASLPLVIARAVRRDPFSALLLAWLAVVAARISIGVVNFDGVRHFLEIFPPIAAIAAIGVVEFAKRISRRPFAVVVLSVVVVVPVAIATWSSHPFEIAYWNVFCGGLGGAQARGIPGSGDYWATSYRDGLDWINRTLPRGSVLLVPIAGHTIKLVAPLRLRADIRFVEYPRGGGRAAAAVRMRQVTTIATQFPTFVMFAPRSEWSTELDRDCLNRLRPVRVWMLDRGVVLLIYRYQLP